MTNGAGFIALAALIFGKWRPEHAPSPAPCCSASPGRCRAGCRSCSVSVGDFSIPSEFWQSLPYVVTIIVVAGAVGRAAAPAADGVPYERRDEPRHDRLGRAPRARPSRPAPAPTRRTPATPSGVGRAGRRRPGAHGLQRRERLVRRHAVRRVRARLGAPRHRRRAARRGGLRRRAGRAAGALRALPAAAARARRPRAAVQRAARSASCCPTPSAPST